jgi:hypothetical protein
LLDIIFFIAFAYFNSKLARRKGLPSSRWALFTVLAMLGGIFLGAMVIYSTYHGPVDYNSVQSFLMHNPLKIFTVYALEIGGALLIRYIIERKPGPTGNAE